MEENKQEMMRRNERTGGGGEEMLAEQSCLYPSQGCWCSLALVCGSQEQEEFYFWTKTVQSAAPSGLCG